MGRLITAVVAIFLALAANAGDIPGLTSRKLPNGLEVIVIENHGSPIVTVEVAVRAGSFVEAPEYN